MVGVIHAKEGGILASCKSSRRVFLSRAVRVLLGGLAFQSTAVEAASGDRRSPKVSWRKAMHYARVRRLAG